ncbi:MAG: hypothetical protein JNL39_13485 [Opitutaceae bacterium]|nr:hypothetical protein [Opitutaceae bacterium]
MSSVAAPKAKKIPMGAMRRKRAPQPLDLPALEKMAERYVAAKDDREAAKLEARFLEGYYGKRRR